MLSYTPFKVIYENDSSLSEGQEKVDQKGMNGCKSITYKVLKLNGAEVSREVLSSDTYDPMNKIIKTGSKQTVATSTTPAQETSSEPVQNQEPQQIEQVVESQTNSETEQETNQNFNSSNEENGGQQEEQNGGNEEQNSETNP